MRFCPYAQRVQLVLNVKNILHHTININLSEKPDWFLDLQQNGKVPALHLVTDHGQPLITESLIIMEYLDEKFPQYPLFPRDPTHKAIDKMWIDRFSSITAAFFRIVIEPRHVDDALLEISDALDLYEDELRRRCTAYFGGKKPGALDYAIWPWFERTELVKVLVGNKFIFDRKRYPTLVSIHFKHNSNSHILFINLNLNFVLFYVLQAAWYELMLHDTAVQKCFLPSDVHAKFFNSRREGAPNYDILA